MVHVSTNAGHLDSLTKDIARGTALGIMSRGTHCKIRIKLDRLFKSGGHEVDQVGFAHRNFPLLACGQNLVCDSPLGNDLRLIH